MQIFAFVGKTCSLYSVVMYSLTFSSFQKSIIIWNVQLLCFVLIALHCFVCFVSPVLPKWMKWKDSMKRIIFHNYNKKTIFYISYFTKASDNYVWNIHLYVGGIHEENYNSKNIFHGKWGQPFIHEKRQRCK
jgi:hypothetical protein